MVYKKLPAAFELLYLIILKAWDGDIPNSWAQAAIALFYKEEDPANPKNYRPIALQSCSGKIFFSIWAKRLEVFMLKNGYFKRAKQKGFLSGVPGCSEHVATLKAALHDAKSSYRQIVVAWIDLKNAFGSVSHNLIQFALDWYHVPAHLADIISTYYEMLVATIETKDWSSKCFVYEIGVFQGCVISPLLFNIVFNLLLDMLSPLTEKLGYKFKECEVTVHDLAYADDLSIVARSVDKAQEALNLVDRFLLWSRTMAAKPSKCRSLALKYWSDADMRAGRTRFVEHAYAPFDPKLKIAGEVMEFIAKESFKFLGWEVYHHLGETKQKEEVRKEFMKRMKLVDETFIHGFMKLWLYQHYITAFLAWPFMIYDFDVSWVSTLEDVANRYLKKWTGLYARAITSVLYRPRDMFGLQLRSLVAFYKRLQIGQSFMLKHSSDVHLNRIYMSTLARQNALKRVWKPSPVMEKLEVQVEHDRSFRGQTDQTGLGFVSGRYTRKLTLSERKQRVLDAQTSSFFTELNLLDMDKGMQGCFLRFTDAEPFDLSWSHLIGTRNPRLVTWVLNASINSVITPDLRKLWGLCPTAECHLCGHPQASLFHILAGCRVALRQLRYSWRHDSVLATAEGPLRRRLEQHNASPCIEERRPIRFRSTKEPIPRPTKQKPPTKNADCSVLGSASDWIMQIDYTKQPAHFPVHICVTDKRPDIVLYSVSSRTVILIELTCPAEENICDAQLRKEVKYTPLKDQIKDNDWKCHLWTIEVGVRGFVAGSVRRCLRRLGFTNTDIRNVVRNMSLSASRCSFAIYKSYRAPRWTWNPLVRIDSSAGNKQMAVQLRTAQKRTAAVSRDSRTKATESLDVIPEDESAISSSDTALVKESEIFQPSANKPEVWIAPDAPPEWFDDMPKRPECKKSVHWDTPVVSEVTIVTRLTKEQVCGTTDVDDWEHFAKTRLESNKNRLAGRTLTISDLDISDVLVED